MLSVRPILRSSGRQMAGLFSISTISKSSAKVVSVEFSTIAHATENLEKVEAAIVKVMPTQVNVPWAFTRRYLKGHHGNPIVISTMRLTNEVVARTCVEHLFKMISPAEKRELEREFQKYLDEEHNFYMRLDKQEAFLGRIRFGREDPIRIKIRIRMLKPTHEKAEEILRNLGMAE